MIVKKNMKIPIGIYVVLIMIFLMVGISGCSVNIGEFLENAEKNIAVGEDRTAEETVEQIFLHLCNGDFEGALEYCKEESNIYYGLAESTQESLLASFAQTFSNEPELVDYFTEDTSFLSLFQTIENQMFDNYEIIKSQEQSDGKFIVYVKADFLEHLDIDTYMQWLNVLRLEYYYSNYEEIEQIYEKKKRLLQ